MTVNGWNIVYLHRKKNTKNGPEFDVNVTCTILMTFDKEKVIAARRSSVERIVLPEANRKDFDELPDYLKEGLEVYFAKTYDDVYKVAFEY